VALCEGEILRVGRVWADGTEIPRERLNLRVIAAPKTRWRMRRSPQWKGRGFAPAYRGVAYVVFEDLDLEEFGNSVPQFSFEVIRAAQGAAARAQTDLCGLRCGPWR
jgi:hypothetical protein